MLAFLLILALAVLSKVAVLLAKAGTSWVIAEHLFKQR